jgi:hypothetical protein
MGKSRTPRTGVVALVLDHPGLAEPAPGPTTATSPCPTGTRYAIYRRCSAGAGFAFLAMPLAVAADAIISAESCHRRVALPGSTA